MIRAPVASARTAKAPSGPRATPPTPAAAAWLALVLVAVLVAWAHSEPSADLFMALAGGRDVAQGKLGAPDDWSFTTAGRVWINQNWLSHLLIYSTWRWGGESGLLVLKAILLSAMAALLVGVARRRGAAWPQAALLSAAIVLACFRFVLLRPNLVTMALVPLAVLLLYRSGENRRRIWWMVPLVALWSNLHGGFVFGLAMVGLWAACLLLEDRRRRRAPMRGSWMPVAVVGACVPACALSPFGITNLLEPLTIAGTAGWRLVPEWLPLLGNDRLPFPWEFLVVLGLVWGLASARLVGRATSRPAPRPGLSDPRAAIAPVAFEYLLLGLATVMAFQSRRFVPLAIVASASPLAGLLAGLAPRARRALTMVLCAGVAVSAGLLGWRHLRAYRSDHPIRSGTSIFDRMHMVSDVFPVAAGQFLAENRIAGNALAAWEWEGYLRWIHPQVRLFMGGRAQQVYPVAVLEAWNRIQVTDDAPRLLRQHQVQWVILPPSARFVPLLSRLTTTREWVPVYHDGAVLVLADGRSASTAEAVRRAIAGEMEYPSEMARALSEASRLLAIEASPDPARVLDTVRRANRDTPTPQAYAYLARLSGGPGIADSVVAYLEDEARRLARLQPRAKGAEGVRRCRITVEQVLAGWYRAGAREADARQAESRALALTREAEAERAAWR